MWWPWAAAEKPRGPAVLAVLKGRRIAHARAASCIRECRQPAAMATGAAPTAAPTYRRRNHRRLGAQPASCATQIDGIWRMPSGVAGNRNPLEVLEQLT